MTAEDIILAVANRHLMTPTAMRGRSRKPRFIAARIEAANRLLDELGLSQKEIGRLLGGFGPSTVQYLTSEVARERRRDNAMQRRRALRVIATGTV